MIDVHSHILPQIDDGVGNASESIEIVKKLSELGFAKLVFTPHLDPIRFKENILNIKNRFAEFGSMLNESRIKMEIVLGSEIILDPTFLQKEPASPLVFTIDERCYQLLELHPIIHPVALEIYSDYINKYKITPIIAHAERIEKISVDKKFQTKLKDTGFRFQVNVASFARHSRMEHHENAKRLFKENMIDILATDCHSLLALEKIIAGLDFIKSKTKAWQKYFEL